MVDISGRLMSGELLRACYVPAVSGSRAAKEFGWEITVHLNGELIGYRNISPLIANPTILLDDSVFDGLKAKLDRLDIDYQPDKTCDGTEFRSLTYLSKKKNRHISYDQGVSDDFDKLDLLDEIWKLLGDLAREVGFGAMHRR